MKSIIIYLSIILLAGCGYKGDLYLPKQSNQDTQLTEPAALKSQSDENIFHHNR